MKTLFGVLYAAAVAIFLAVLKTVEFVLKSVCIVTGAAFFAVMALPILLPLYAVAKLKEKLAERHATSKQSLRLPSRLPSFFSWLATVFTRPFSALGTLRNRERSRRRERFDHAVRDSIQRQPDVVREQFGPRTANLNHRHGRDRRETAVA